MSGETKTGKNKPIMVFHHDDPPCKARLDASGYCPLCEVYPDMQSKRLFPYCPVCDVLLKKLVCPVCHRKFEGVLVKGGAYEANLARHQELYGKMVSLLEKFENVPSGKFSLKELHFLLKMFDVHSFNDPFFDQPDNEKMLNELVEEIANIEKRS